jgi:hypothetical protein
MWPNYKVANVTVQTVSSCRSDCQISTHIDKNKRQVNGSIEGLNCWLEQIHQAIKLLTEWANILNINNDKINNNNHTLLPDAGGTTSTKSHVRPKDSVL